MQASQRSLLGVGLGFATFFSGNLWNLCMDRYHDPADTLALQAPIEWGDREHAGAGNGPGSRFEIECQQYERHSLGLFDGLHCMDAPVPRSCRTGTK